MSKLEYDLDDIFSLLICAEVYAFGHDILYSSLIKPHKDEVNNDDKIDSYLSRTYPPSKYTKEQIDEYKFILKSLIEMYIK